MAKTPVVLVTFYRTTALLADLNRPGRTIAFNAFTREVIPAFCRHNKRPYYSAAAAIERSGTHQEVAGFWGIDWLRCWDARAELDRHRRVHGVEPITANAHRDRLGGPDWRGEGVEP